MKKDKNMAEKGQGWEDKKSQRKKEFGMMASLLKIGCIGFGGGSALIPVIEKEVVEEQKLVTEEEYNKDVVVASITPGALPMEIATGLGKRAYGVGGMILSANMMAFPGALATVLLLSVMSRVSSSVLAQIEILSMGISAFIACLLTEYARKTLAEARAESKGRWKRAVVILAGVFLLSGGKAVYNILGIKSDPIFCLSTLQVLGIAFFGILYTRCKFTRKNVLIAGIIIAMYIFTISQPWFALGYLEMGLKILMAVLSVWGLYGSIAASGKRKKVSCVRLTKELAAWLLFMLLLSAPALVIGKELVVFLSRGFASSIMSFGGGDAYLSVADGMFVHSGMIPQNEFYAHLVPLVNLLPGSILCKTLSGVGYLLGYEMTGSTMAGYLAALAGFSSSVMASGSVFCLVYYIYECFEKLDVFRLLSRWIRPIIAGLLLTVMCSLIFQNLQTGAKLGLHGITAMGVTVLIYGLNLVLLYVGKKKNGTLIAFSAITVLILCNLLTVL